jgi:RNA polymerase sigma-B factor
MPPGDRPPAAAPQDGTSAASAASSARATKRGEIEELCREYRRTGRRSVRNEIVERHMGVVEPYVHRYSGRGIAAEDLRQTGMLAIIRAVDRFDPDVGVQFATFASRTVEGELKRLLRDRSWSVRPPRRQQEVFLVVRRAEDELSQTLGRPPTIRELAAATDQSEEHVLEALEAGGARHAASLDQPVGEHGQTTASFLGAPDRDANRVEVRMVVERLLEDLDARSREVIQLRFYQEMGQPEIAERLGLSQSYVSRLIRRILATMQEQLEAGDEVTADADTLTATGPGVEGAEAP